MNANAGVPTHLADRLTDLGNVPLERIRSGTAMGAATLEDWQRSVDAGALCELVDGTLLDKPMGFREALLASILLRILGVHVAERRLGFVMGTDGFIRLYGEQVRAADAAYFSWKRLPGGNIPDGFAPAVVPDLAVEVLSPSNTLAEMSRKRREYFQAGVRMVWMIDLSERTVAVYTSDTECRVLQDNETLSGGDVLPELRIELSEYFGELDRPGE